MYKKVNVVRLPTNEKVNITMSLMNILLIGGSHPENNQYRNQHLYITSNDEIKEGDWYLAIDTIEQCSCKDEANDLTNNCKKIIATTDSSLQWLDTSEKNLELARPNGLWKCLPQISQSFIEVFVREYNKGNVITDVLVEYDNSIEYWESRGGWKSGGSFKVFTQPKSGEYNCIMDYYPVKLKINPKDNTINIKLVKDNWNKEEVEELVNKAFKAGYERSHSGYPNTDNHKTLS